MERYIDRIHTIGKELEDEIITFCQKLIRIPSLSGKEKNIAKLCVAELHRLNYDEVLTDEAGNVIGIVYGTEEGPTVLFSSHLDHIEAGGSERWGGYESYGGCIDLCDVYEGTSDQVVQEKCIHGRGASDAKGGAASQIYGGAILAELKRKNFPVKGNYIYVGLVNEENGTLAGAHYFYEYTMKKENMKCDVVVTSEATGLNLFLGNRGRVEFRVDIYGKSAHSGKPDDGVNAIVKAADFIEYYVKQNQGNVMKYDQGLGYATVTPVAISEDKTNTFVIQDHCSIVLDRRLVSGESVELCQNQIERAIDEMQRRDPDFRASVSINRRNERTYTGLELENDCVMKPWKISKDHILVTAAQSVLQEMGQNTKFGYWKIGSEASVFAGEGDIPTIGYSPMQEQYAHTSNDRLRIDYLLKAVEGNAAIFYSLGECGMSF